ncbi:MAG TPA: hypothetical protein VMV73_02670 [Candidatus Dormibacteraeota bacterium]|nr:hypothetical protein [Candidatus Dormibacteraeota bacterium]
MQPPLDDVPSAEAERTSFASDPRRANQEALRLRAGGDARGAVALLDLAIERSPSTAELYVNRGVIAAELGDRTRARESYERALDLDASQLAARLGLAAEMYAAGNLEDARSQYRLALGLEQENIVAHLAMYELELQIGDRSKALAHQRRALARQQLFSSIAPYQERSLLVLCTPGDWFANTPVEFLIDRERTTIHKLYLTSPEHLAALELPQFEVVFNAIGESTENTEKLLLAQIVGRLLGRPLLNDPLRVLETNRVRCAQLAAKVHGCNAPQTIAYTRAHLQSLPVTEPAIVRPRDSHAGKGARRITSSGELQLYLQENDYEHFYLTPWVNYSNADGFFRKYRFVAVDGNLYPYHLAISSNWMVHYYSSEMRAEAWMRDEEERFLDDWRAIFPPDAARALELLVESLALEYVGFDCSIDQDGKLMFFEADPAIIVHLTDDPTLFPYKHRCVPAIFRAFERMIDRRARPS